MKYSIYADPEKTAKAYGRDLHCSPKHSENIVRAIKGMEVGKAKQLLEDVIPVSYTHLTLPTKA